MLNRKGNIFKVNKLSNQINKPNKKLINVVLVLELNQTKKSKKAQIRTVKMKLIINTMHLIQKQLNEKNLHEAYIYNVT